MNMGRPQDTPGFWELFNEWNKKLHDSGFNDAERLVSGELVLKTVGHEMVRHKNANEDYRNAKARYYSLVSECVEKTVFQDDREKQILTLYSQGFSQAAIHRMLGIQGHRCKVYNPLYRWLRVWGLK